MIRDRIQALLPRLAPDLEYPTQGVTVFVDLERQETARAYTPRAVVETFLGGRGSNMFYLYNLLDPASDPLSPDTPLIFGSGILTGIVPSAARGNVSSWSPETRVILDANAGDWFPSFLKLNGIDHLVLFGKAREFTVLVVREGRIEFRRADGYVGLDNLDLRERVARDLGGTWTRDLAMASITSAGERGVLCSGIMAGPKAIYARGGPGAKMGSLGLKAVITHGWDMRCAQGANGEAIKPANRQIAAMLLDTGVVKHALKLRGTPFLYKPSRILGAMGALNNQKNTWTAALDAENIDPYRPHLEGCFRCPVNCRPANDLKDQGQGDRYDRGDGPEYVTVGKFGPMIGVEDVKQLIRLNNIANDLGLDTASLGSSIAWAMELYQRGIIDRDRTCGLDLTWGNTAAIEQLFFLTARREGFGNVVAASARAVDEGHYPREALRYRMAVKGLMQSDPHDARIIKAFALGLAVATRGMDHLRNRVTLEINAKINDDPKYKAELYGGPVSAKPNSYDDKERAVRACEDTFAVGDAVGMCRFTTKLFNSPNLPGAEEFSRQIENVTGLAIPPRALLECGLNITGLERMINHRLGVRKADDTLPERWFDEGLPWGPYAGERIHRDEFQKLLDRFYDLSGFNDEGQPKLPLRARLARVAAGFAITVKVPASLRPLPEGGVVVTEPVANLKDLARALDRAAPGLGEMLKDDAFNVAVNDEIVLHGEADRQLKSGDRVELVPALAGG